MTMECVNSGGSYVVKVAGCLDTTATGDFRRVVEGIPAGTSNVTFDFAGLEFIASSALRVMVTLGKGLHETGGKIVVSGANETVRDVFEMTGLVEVFDVR